MTTVPAYVTRTSFVSEGFIIDTVSVHQVAQSQFIIIASMHRPPRRRIENILIPKKNGDPIFSTEDAARTAMDEWDRS